MSRSRANTSKPGGVPSVPYDYYPYRCRADAIEEYRSLRAEIVESQKQRVSLLQYSLLFIGVLFGYLYKDAALDPDEALLLVAVSIPCALFSYATRCRERRIAKYIAVFMSQLSPWSVISASSPGLGFTQRASTSIVLTMLLLNGIALFVSLPKQWAGCPPKCSHWLLAFCGGVINFIILLRVTRLPDYGPAMLKILKQIREADQGKQTCTRHPEGHEDAPSGSAGASCS
jgi:hypothetical protein